MVSIEDRECRAIHVPAHDDGQAAPVAWVGRADDFGSILQWRRWADDIEAKQFLTDAEGVARFQRFFLRELHEHAVQAAQVTNFEPPLAENEIGVARRQVRVGVEEMALASSDQVFTLLHRPAGGVDGEN